MVASRITTAHPSSSRCRTHPSWLLARAGLDGSSQAVRCSAQIRIPCRCLSTWVQIPASPDRNQVHVDMRDAVPFHGDTSARSACRRCHRRRQLSHTRE